MTKAVVIDMESTPPRVFINGFQVACNLSVTFHKEGGLKIKTLSLKNIPVEVSA